MERLQGVLLLCQVYLKRPALPMQFLFKYNSKEELIRKRKKIKKRKFFSFEKAPLTLETMDYEELIDWLFIDEPKRVI